MAGGGQLARPDVGSGGRATPLPQPQAHPEALQAVALCGGPGGEAQANIEARKARNFTVTKDADGNVVLTLDDGTVATLPTA